MDWDEVRSKPAAGAVVGESLEKLSVSELESRIKAFEAEILRVSSELAKKKAQQAAAAQLFKP